MKVTFTSASARPIYPGCLRLYIVLGLTQSIPSPTSAHNSSKREVSYKCFLDDLKRCEQLGIKLYNWHPGSTVGACTKSESLKLVAESINRAHKETSTVICVIENMAGAGNILGSKWEELAEIIEGVEDKSRVGVCIDTCKCFFVVGSPGGLGPKGPGH